MKLLSTILTAAMIVGSATTAMAQANSDEVNPGQIGRGGDDNPTGVFGNPEAGNTAAPAWERLPGGESDPAPYQYGPNAYREGGLISAPVSGTWSDDSWSDPYITLGGSRR